jgi:hypothetical protein
VTGIDVVEDQPGAVEHERKLAGDLGYRQEVEVVAYAASD